MFDDDDYGDIFITQSSRSVEDNAPVSLKDNGEFRSVLDDKYSDISDAEGDDTMFEERLR